MVRQSALALTVFAMISIISPSADAQSTPAPAAEAPAAEAPAAQSAEVQAAAQPAWTQPVVAQPVEAQVSPNSVPASSFAVAQPQCPDGGQMMPNRWGTPVCMQQVTRRQVNWDLVGSGAGIFGGTWLFQVIFTLASAGVGAVQNPAWSNAHGTDYINWGVVPLLGPWVQMAFVPPQFDAGVYAVLAAEALIQAGGIALAVLGFIGDEVPRWVPMAGLELRVAPMLGETNGVAVQGSF